MRLASSLVGLSLSAALCASAHAQTPSPAAPASAYDEQSVGVRNLGGASRELARSGERPDWMYADGGWDAFRGSDHHPISEEAFYRIVGRDDLRLRYHREAVVKKSLTIGGGTLVLGGLLFAAVAAALRYGGAQPAISCPRAPAVPATAGPEPRLGSRNRRRRRPLLIVGHYLDPTPIDASEADLLARDYDRSLRSSLGISETAARD